MNDLIIWNMILIFQSRSEGMSIKFIHDSFVWISEPYVAERSCVKRVDCNLSTQQHTNHAQDNDTQYKPP